MIPSFEGWTFHEFIIDDNAGVITEWKKSLVIEEDRAVIDACLLNWRQLQQNDDLWDRKFESFDGYFKIGIRLSAARYRIYASRKSVYEIVLLFAVEEQKSGRVPPNTISIVNERLETLRQHPEKCREYVY